MWNNDRDRFIREAMEARRRISTEAMQIRNYLNLCFADDPNTGLIVTGDLNDGPGADYFERLYLTHNVAGMIAGSPFAPQRMLRHAFIDIRAKEPELYRALRQLRRRDRRSAAPVGSRFPPSPSLFWNANNGDRNAIGLIEHQAFEDEEDPTAPQDKPPAVAKRPPPAVRDTGGLERCARPGAMSCRRARPPGTDSICL